VADDDPQDEDAATDDESSSSRLPRISLSGTMSRVVRSERTAGAVAGMEDAIAKFRRERKIGKGTLRSTYVVGYRGFVAEGHAYARVRVTEEPVVPAPAEALTDPEVLRSNLRRFVALSFPGVKVQVSIGDRVDLMETDRHGYASGNITVGELVVGWHDYTVVTEPDDDNEEPARARGRVLVPDPRAKVWVISDIDDTVLQTGLAEGLTAVKNTLFGQAHTRHAVPGMATLYRALEAGRPGDGRSAFFYLSTGPWSLYSVLAEFMKVRGFPDGPMFLTDWGPQERYITRSGTEHKRQTLRRLAAHFPDRRFVLIGDSGQRDPYTYAEFAREHPDSVAAIVIVDVGLAERAEEVSAHSELAVADGLPFFFVADAREAAVKLAELELITAESIEAVNRAYERS
jgi:phosphatidate phosphatase APP1